MTAEMLLDRLRAKGVEIRADGDQLNLRPASALSAEELAQARVLKPELIRLLALQVQPTPAYHLRLAYRCWFELTVAEVDGQRINPAKAQVLHQRIVKLTDETGVLFSDAIYADELRRFRWETARCGLCGGLGHVGPEPEAR